MASSRVKDDVDSKLPSIKKRSALAGFFHTLFSIILFPLQCILIWFKPRESLSPTMRHSYFVARLKVFMVSLSVALIIALIIWPLLDDGQKVSFESVDITEEDATQLRMKKPRFYGVDEKNQPYTIIADEAIQLDESSVKLINMQGKIELENSHVYEMSSDDGVYDIENQSVLLKGNIHVEVQQGYELFTEILDVNIREGFAKGEKKVTINGPLGNVVANQFNIENGGGVLNFYEDVKATVYRRDQSMSQTEEGR